MKALIIVDVQNDFLQAGALAVPQGDEIIDLINKIQSKYDTVVATQDWHPANHKSFAAMHPQYHIFDTIELGLITVCRARPVPNSLSFYIWIIFRLYSEKEWIKTWIVTVHSLIITEFTVPDLMVI